MPQPSEPARDAPQTTAAPGANKPAKDAPVAPADVARKPPTRQGGADAGMTADDPGRGGD